MKNVIVVLVIACCLFGCAAKETRVPLGPGLAKTPAAGADEAFKPLPGDQNIKSSEVAYNLALEYAGARNMVAAHHYIDLAMKLQPNAKYSYTKGVFCLGEKRFERAIAWLDRAMSEQPGELQAKMDIINAQGIALMQLKKLDDAKAKFREIINTEGMVSKFNAYFNLGLIYLDENNTADAENAFRKAIEENPGDYRVYMKLGRIAMIKGDYLSAYGDFQKAGELAEPVYSALQADGPEIYYSLGESLARLKKIDESRAALLKVVKIAPEGPYGMKAKDLLSRLPVE